MRVLIVINGLGTGGAERSIAELLPGLRDAGIDATVACLYRRGEGVEEEVRRAGFDVRILGEGRLPGRVRALRRLIGEIRPALIHTTIFESNLAGRLAAAGTSVPVLTSLVNILYEGRRLEDPSVRPWRVALARRIDAWTSRRLTAHFHAITEAVKRASVTALGVPPDRITVIERGRDPARLGRPGPERRERARRELGLAAEHEVLVNVARRDHQKGQIHLLEAVAALRDVRPRLVALVAGRTGNAWSRLEARQRELGLEEPVRFVGHRGDLPELLAAADVFVFPSLWEGLGGSLIEAMALGLPIVASDLEAIREVVEDGRNAVLVPPGDSRALADAISSLLDDPARRAAFGGRSREIFEARFTLEASTRRMIELYRRVASEGGGSAPG